VFAQLTWFGRRDPSRHTARATTRVPRSPEPRRASRYAPRATDAVFGPSAFMSAALAAQRDTAPPRGRGSRTRGATHASATAGRAHRGHLQGTTNRRPSITNLAASSSGISARRSSMAGRRSDQGWTRESLPEHLDAVRPYAPWSSCLAVEREEVVARGDADAPTGAPTRLEIRSGGPSYQPVRSWYVTSNVSGSKPTTAPSIRFLTISSIGAVGSLQQTATSRVTAGKLE